MFGTNDDDQTLYKALSGGRAPIDKKVFGAMEDIAVDPNTENSKKLKEEIDRAYPGCYPRFYKDKNDITGRTTNIEIRDKAGVVYVQSIFRMDPDIRSI